MIEGGKHFGFPLEPRKPVGIARDRCRQYLDRHRALQIRVGRAIDLSHAAGPDGRDDLVRAETGAGLKGHA